MSSTACVIPWTSFNLDPQGTASFCCESTAKLTVDGRPGSVYRDSLDQLWNSADIVAVRAAMARGEKPPTCNICWEREARGTVSKRLVVNAEYQAAGGRLTVAGLAREGAGSGFRLARAPDWFIFELGNVCNLRCRSCNPLSSSSIAADAVHSAWAAHQATAHPHRPWYQEIDKVADMIACGAGENALLSLMGGEPFLIDTTWLLLEALVERGVASRIGVGLATNGQQRRAELTALAPRFRQFSIVVSIDGHGRLFEYLRHPARWNTLVDNLRWFRTMPAVTVTATPTLQNSNVLSIVSLLRFLDEHELPIGYNVLNWPERLQPTNVPPRARRLAVSRLRRYLDRECPAYNWRVVNGYLEILEAAGDSFNAERFAEFMAFTNDLDAERGQSLRTAAPELWEQIRTSGVTWSTERRHSKARALGDTAPSPSDPRQRSAVNRTIADADRVYPGYAAHHPEAYFSSALTQLHVLDALFTGHGHAGLATSRAVADYACHYGRIVRALRASYPHADVYACDIDPEAARFCAQEFGALPITTDWQPDPRCLPTNVDAVICVSLFTHTPLEHWRQTLRVWAPMLRPGGMVAFTFLGPGLVAPWLDGTMEQYGLYPEPAREEVRRGLAAAGFGFASLGDAYGGPDRYGIAFATPETVRREIVAAGLEVLEISSEPHAAFAQNLVLARKPAGEQEADSPGRAPAVVADVRRDVRVLALYDPRGYAPAELSEGAAAMSIWARLTSRAPGPLPTELGFADPRVSEVREAQAKLAREHGIDGFCWLYPWTPAGPRWDGPLRDLLRSGRPEFPFCLMATFGSDDEETPYTVRGTARLIGDVAPALTDSRYVRLDGRPVLLIRGIERLADPRAAVAAWRAAAQAQGIDALHIGANEPEGADRPETLGFDSFFERPAATDLGAAAVAAALTRPWPPYHLFRTVHCRRDAIDRFGWEWYEHWLQSLLDATRRHGEPLLFIDSWNDWLESSYLEPDDRDQRAALAATRRAIRGPSSGLVLWRRLRDALDGSERPVADATLEELRSVLELHEHTRDQLLAAVDLAIERRSERESQRWVPVNGRTLPRSHGRFSLDRIGPAFGPAIADARGPIPLSTDEVPVAGWAHAPDWPPDSVSIFVAFESCDSQQDRVYRLVGREKRPDVNAAYPRLPERCGFAGSLDLSDLPSGTYRIAIVQHTPRATYRDLTAVRVRRDSTACSSG